MNSIDPNYFSPGEAAWKSRRLGERGTDAKILNKIGVMKVGAYPYPGRRTSRTGFLQRLRTRLETLPMTVPAMAPCPWAPMMTMS